MQHLDRLTLAIFGMILASLAGFGNHILVRFRGRSLEAYCRLRGNRDLYGDILDEQADARTACHYLFIFGSSATLIAGGLWLSSYLSSGLTDSHANSVTLFQIASYCIITAAMQACLFFWVPKIVVRNSASVILYHTWWFWRALNLLFRPFRALEHLFVAIGHRLSDLHVDDRLNEESLEDEIRKMVMTGERKGLVTRSMREIMTPRSKIDAIDIDWTWNKMLEAVTQSGRTRMPVYENSIDNIIGILFVKDVMALLKQTDSPDDAAEIKGILRESWMIPATRQVDELLKDFLRRRSHMAIVDEFQQTLGVVTIEDALEEIVGEIADELDVDETLPLFLEDPDGGYSLSGIMEVSAANRLLALDLPESDDYDTIGGLVVSAFCAIPKIGAKTRIGKYQLSVTQADPRHVQRVRLAILPTPALSSQKH
jgi:putative hemolysin